MHYMFILQCCDVDIDSEVSSVTQSEPFLLLTGEPGIENCQVFICCEAELYIESKSIKDALVDLISTYFVFDIVYPKNFRNILLFIQHFVLDLPEFLQSFQLLLPICRNLNKHALFNLLMYYNYVYLMYDYLHFSI